MSGSYMIDGEAVPMTPEVEAAMIVEPVPDPVPAEITNFQARAALMGLPGSAPGRTLFHDIDDALRGGKDASPEGALAWQAWEQANVFTRAGSLVNTLGPSFGLTSAQLDDLFRAAVGIEA